MSDCATHTLLLETERQARAKALEDAANYLRARAEALRKKQVREYSGERDRNINALIMWANQVRKL